MADLDVIYLEDRQRVHLLSTLKEECSRISGWL